METTSPTLLYKVKNNRDQVAWQRFVDLYTPLIFQTARSKGLCTADAEEVVQQTFTKMVQVMPQFEYDPLRQGFRTWLRTIVSNLIIDSYRKRSRTKPFDPQENAEPIDPVGSELTDQDLLQSLTGQILRIVQRDFEEKTWRAFWELVVHGRSGKEVAAELGVAESTVYVAKLRVGRRLAKELKSLRDSD